MITTKKKAEIAHQCVACGSCVKICPLNAISIHKGIKAVVNEQKCVGCGKCVAACPAAVICIVEMEGAKNEAKALV